jgi:mevalonate kinase
MNSENLQEAFPEVYRDFFCKNNLVVSSNRLFWWTGEYAELFGGAAIVQKLPLKIYVGLESYRQNSIKIESYKIFIPAHKSFEEKIFNQFTEKRLYSFLKPLLINLNNGQPFPGFKINILAELSLERGLGSFGSLSAALIVAILLFLKKIDKSVLGSWQNKEFFELIQNQELKFNYIFKLAWKMEAAIDSSQASGCRSFCSLVNCDNPIIYFTEKRSGDVNYHQGARVPSDIDSHFEILDHTNYWAYDFNKFFNLKGMSDWPIDYGLIFSGDLRLTGNIIRTGMNTRNVLENLCLDLTKHFDKYFKQPTPLPSPMFYEWMVNEKSEGLWRRYISALATISLETLKNFKDVFESGGSEETLNNFFKSLNNYQYVFHLLKISSTTLDYICYYIYHETMQKNGGQIGIKFSGSGGGGDVVFAMPYGKYQDLIEKCIENLRQKTKKDVDLDYASWLDGFSSEGVIIQQDLASQVYSPYISKESVCVRFQTKDKKGETDIVTLESFEKIKSKLDLILDEAENKIYIRGKSLSSKEIHSSKVTIEVLKVLLENLDKEVFSRQFKPSSYIDRNEMQSKIISPLSLVIKKRLNKKLLLKISGGLGKNFMMKLSSSNLKIAQIIRRI